MMPEQLRQLVAEAPLAGLRLGALNRHMAAQRALSKARASRLPCARKSLTSRTEPRHAGGAGNIPNSGVQPVESPWDDPD